MEEAQGAANCLFCQLRESSGITRPETRVRAEERTGYLCPHTAGWQPASAVPDVNQNIEINQFLFIPA